MMFVAYYAIEQCLKVWAMGPARYCWHKTNVFEGVITLALVVSTHTHMHACTLHVCTHTHAYMCIVTHKHTNTRVAYHYGFSVIITEIDIRLR